MKKIVLSSVCIMLLIVGIFAVKYLIDLQKYKKIIKELKIGSVNLSKVSDGKYIGYCNGVYVEAKVSVRVKDHKITEIIILNHKNERGKPAEVITEKVLKAQSLQVDTVSGATNSSKVILKSIENALKSGDQ